MLVIDDNETLREGMAISINKLGHEVSVCANGADRIAAFCKQRFDFVVTDLKTAPVDGLEVVRRLREADAEAVVLVVTAYATIEPAVEAMKLWAFDFIAKPFPPEVLRAKVEKGLEVGRATSPGSRPTTSCSSATRAAGWGARGSSAARSRCSGCSPPCARWRPATPRC